MVGSELVLPDFESRKMADPRDERSVLFSAIAQKWWLYALFAAISAVIAFGLSTVLKQDTYRIEGALIHEGLTGDATTFLAPASLSTSRELFYLPGNLRRLIDRQKLDCSLERFRKQLECNIPHGSALVNFSTVWDDQTEGLEVIAEAMRLFTDLSNAYQRRKLEEVEGSIANDRSTLEAGVEDLRNRYLAAAVKEQKLLPRMEAIADQNQHRQVARAGFERQVEQTKLVQRRIEQLLRDKLVRNRLAQILIAKDKWSPQHLRWKELDQIQHHVGALQSADDLSFDNWLQHLNLTGATILPHTEPTQEIQQLWNDLQHVRRGQPELELVHFESEAGPGTQNSDSDVTSEAATDVSIALDQLRRQFDTAMVQLDALARKDDVLDKLVARYDVRATGSDFGPEFAESGAASVVDTYSNRRKAFAICGAATFLLLSFPVLAHDVAKLRTSELQAFAKSMGIPVIASRLVGPAQSGRARPDWHESSELRLAALRVQQSVNRPGAVVLFAGLGKRNTPGQLVASVATCLANRRQRILVINAVCPRSAGPILGFENAAGVAVDKSEGSSGRSGKSGIPAVSRPGLSELLRQHVERQAVVRHTGNPLVDVIDCGSAGFPLEAMASPVIDDLFARAATEYSLVLVLGTSTDEAADFQMLAARADAIVLTTDRHSTRKPASRAAIEDLVELRAPLVGIIG